MIPPSRSSSLPSWIIRLLYVHFLFLLLFFHLISIFCVSPFGLVNLCCLSILLGILEVGRFRMSWWSTIFLGAASTAPICGCKLLRLFFFILSLLQYFVITYKKSSFSNLFKVREMYVKCIYNCVQLPETEISKDSLTNGF